MRVTTNTMSTQRTDECCEKCKGFSRALGDSPCKNSDCTCHTNDESVVEEPLSVFQSILNQIIVDEDNGEHNADYYKEYYTKIMNTALLTSQSTQHKAEVEKAVEEERVRVREWAKRNARTEDTMMSDFPENHEWTVDYHELVDFLTPEGTKD